MTVDAKEILRVLNLIESMKSMGLSYEDIICELEAKAAYELSNL